MTSRKAKRLQRSKGSSKLPYLANIANEHHHYVCKHWQGLLQHAREAGEALNKARRYCSYGTWQKWLQDNFNGSYETAQAYRKIASKWNDPHIKHARRRGVRIDSIKSFLDVLKGVPQERKIPKRLLNKDGTLSLKKAKEEEIRKNVREMFAGALRNLDQSEVDVFWECFHEIWEKFYETILYPATCQVLEIDLHQFIVDRWEALKHTRPTPPPQKPLKKMSRWEIKRMAEKQAREDMKFPNIEYRQKKLKEQKVREKEMRKRKRLASRKMMQNMRRRKRA
jgi:hypothetical protein